MYAEKYPPDHKPTRNISIGPTVERGLQAEVMFEKLLKGPFQEAFYFTDDIDNVSPELFQRKIVCRRATPQEDRDQKFDFIFYFGSRDNFLKVDITTARKPGVISYKKRNECNRNHEDYVIFFLNFGVLNNASNGSVRAQDKILTELIQTFFNEGKLKYNQNDGKYCLP